MTELLRLAKEVSTTYSELKADIEALLDACDAEINNGAAEQYEIEYCYDVIKKWAKIHENKNESLV
jgi:predicted transcriptional regulator